MESTFSIIPSGALVMIGLLVLTLAFHLVAKGIIGIDPLVKLINIFKIAVVTTGLTTAAFVIFEISKDFDYEVEQRPKIVQQDSLEVRRVKSGIYLPMTWQSRD